MSSAIFKGTDNQGNNKYQLSACAGYDCNGKQKRKRKTIIAKNQKLADKAALKWESELHETPYVSNTTMTFSEYSDYYLSKRINKITLSTYTLYKNIIKTQMLPFLGCTRLQKINKDTIISFINWLNTLSNRNNSKKPLSDRSKHMAFSYLSTMLKFAVSWELISVNPCTLLSIDERPKPNYHKRAAYEKAEITTLLSAYENLPNTLLYTQQKAALYLALITGARRGEITALKWENISLNENQLSICMSNSILNGKVHTGETKTRSSIRKVYFSINEQNILMNLKALQNDYLTRKNFSNPNDWVFISIRNVPKNKIVKPISPNAVYTFLQEIQAKNGLKKNSFHELRHTAATWAVELNVPLAEISHMLGHSKISTTALYVHSVDDGKEKLANQLSSFYNTLRK